MNNRSYYELRVEHALHFLVSQDWVKDYRFAAPNSNLDRERKTDCIVWPHDTFDLPRLDVQIKSVTFKKKKKGAYKRTLRMKGVKLLQLRPDAGTDEIKARILFLLFNPQLTGSPVPIRAQFRKFTGKRRLSTVWDSVVYSLNILQNEEHIAHFDFDPRQNVFQVHTLPSGKTKSLAVSNPTKVLILNRITATEKLKQFLLYK